MLLTAALFLFLLALVLLWQSSRQQHAAGLPGGRVIYTDTRGWGEVEKPLYDPVVGLTGRPDYLVKKGKDVIPVEVKTSRTPDAPYDSHIFQLAAYCLLVARGMKRRPPYGILHYPKRTYAVDYTEALETSLLDLLVEIRNLERNEEAYRSHEQLPRCNSCGFRNDCDQRL
ncbi:MAG: Dna2/Cas4 domain-containing protein [Chloroflexi bacterium]|nr:Dna2/Cas4 domain-containing protein [Chloroflexota bacterium]